MFRWILGAVVAVSLIWGTVLALAVLAALTDDEAASATEAGMVTFLGLCFLAVPATVFVLAAIVVAAIADRRR